MVSQPPKSQRARNRQQRNLNLKSHQTAVNQPTQRLNESSATLPPNFEKLMNLSPDLQNLSQEQLMEALSQMEAEDQQNHQQSQHQSQSRKRTTGSSGSASENTEAKAALTGKYKVLADEYEVSLGGLGTMLNFAGALLGKEALSKDGTAILIHAHNCGTQLGLLAKKYKQVYETLSKISEVSTIVGVILAFGMLSSTIANNHGFKTPAFDNPDLVNSLVEGLSSNAGTNASAVPSAA